MKKRTPKLVGIRKKPAQKEPKSEREPPYVSREKTRKERLYDVIYDACRKGYRFTDAEYGLPFIGKARGNPTASALGGIAPPPFWFWFA